MRSLSLLNSARQKLKNLLSNKILQLFILGAGWLFGLAAVGWGVWGIAVSSQPVDETFIAPPSLATVGKIQVDVGGAVKQPGIYSLEFDSRIAQALTSAQGLDDQADREFVQRQLNLAEKLKDGQKLYIPFLIERQIEEATEAQTLVSEDNSASGLINLNTASQKELESLPGIGEKRASNMIEARPYLTLEELLSKEIVSDLLFTEIRPLLKI